MLAVAVQKVYITYNEKLHYIVLAIVHGCMPDLLKFFSKKYVNVYMQSMYVSMRVCSAQ